jgi:hypothetical protein
MFLLIVGDERVGVASNGLTFMPCYIIVSRRGVTQTNEHGVHRSLFSFLKKGKWDNNSGMFYSLFGIR